MPTIQNNYLDATLLETNEAVDLGKDALGLGFKENISEQIKAVQAMRVWQAYSKIAALRESTQQLDSIIASLQECIQKASEGGSAVIVSRLFTLKRQLSASPGYSSWVLKCIADIVDEKLGPVTEAELHTMCTDIQRFAHSKYTKGKDGLNQAVNMWARLFGSKYAWSIQDYKAKMEEHKDSFFPTIALDLHQVRHQRANRPAVLRWFFWGLVRNVNKGYAGWLDDTEPLQLCKKEKGRMVWVSLGFPLMMWTRDIATLDLGPFRSGEDGGILEWEFGELISLDLPKIAMDLVNLRSAMNEQMSQVFGLQAKALALLVSACVTGFQLLGKAVIGSGEASQVLGNYTG